VGSDTLNLTSKKPKKRIWKVKARDPLPDDENEEEGEVKSEVG
jgi:hypothetical protein